MFTELYRRVNERTQKRVFKTRPPFVLRTQVPAHVGVGQLMGGPRPASEVWFQSCRVKRVLRSQSTLQKPAAGRKVLKFVNVDLQGTDWESCT